MLKTLNRLQALSLHSHRHQCHTDPCFIHCHTSTNHPQADLAKASRPLSGTTRAPSSSAHSSRLERTGLSAFMKPHPGHTGDTATDAVDAQETGPPPVPRRYGRMSADEHVNFPSVQAVAESRSRSSASGGSERGFRLFLLSFVQLCFFTVDTCGGGWLK